ncbi:hypothetical protein C1645_863864, partial [Glomus cerebriforme]
EVGETLLACRQIKFGKDKLKSSISKRKKKKVKRIDKAISRIFRRIKNLRNELHKKTVNYLAKNYDVVIIPKFNKDQFKNCAEYVNIVILFILTMAEIQS